MKAEQIRGHLDAVILSVLEAGPMHGYLLIDALRERSGGLLGLPTGTVYPALHRLESSKLIRGEWLVVGGRRRRTYELTARGRSLLATERSDWSEFVSTISALLESISRPSGAEVARG